MDKNIQETLNKFIANMNKATDEEIDNQIKLIEKELGKMIENPLQMQFLGILYDIKEKRGEK